MKEQKGKPNRKVKGATSIPLSKRLKFREKHLRPSKSEDFLERIREDNGMIEYLSSLQIMNPAAKTILKPEKRKREGGYVNIAHANQEFDAPKIQKGKSASSKNHSSK